MEFGGREKEVRLMRDGESVLQRFRRGIASVGFSEMIVLYADRRVTVRGCRRILTYSPGEIGLALRGRAVRVMGKELRCVSFSGGCATVEGRIDAVAFAERKGEGNP